MEYVVCYRDNMIDRKREGYVRYRESLDKYKYLYFCYVELYVLLGDAKATKFIEQLRNSNKPNQCKERKSLKRLRLDKLYHGTSSDQHMLNRKRIQKNYGNLNDCFYNAIESKLIVTKKQSTFLKKELRNKSLDYQIEFINSFQQDMILFKRKSVKMILGNIEIDVKRISLIVFECSPSKSYTILYVPGEEVTDSEFKLLRDYELNVKIVDIYS